MTSNYASLSGQEFATVRFEDNNSANPGLLDSASRSTIASMLLPPTEPGAEWMEGQASRLKKQQAVIRSQGTKIAELEQELKAHRRPKKAEARISEMQEKISELEQLAAVQARQMNTEFSQLVAAMNELDKAKGKYSSQRGPQGDLASTETYRSSVLRQHAQQLAEAESVEGKVAGLTKELHDLEINAEAARLRNVGEEQEADRRLTRLNVEITSKESELRNLQFQLHSAQTDLEWTANSKGSMEEKMARLERGYRQQEVEHHVQYLEIINKISDVQVEVEAAELRHSEAERDLESESHKMRVAFENHSIMTNMLKPSPASRGPQPAPPEPTPPQQQHSQREGLSFDASSGVDPPWWRMRGDEAVAMAQAQTQAGPRAPVARNAPYQPPAEAVTVGEC